MLPRGFNPEMNFGSHLKRAQELMAEWRESQGKRAAGGVTEVMRALEHMAQPYANVAAWTNNPKPLRLSRGQVRICQQRAISQERLRRFGTLPSDGDAWWAQIQEVSSGWGIEAKYEHWGQMPKPPTTPQAKEAA